MQQCGGNVSSGGGVGGGVGGGGVLIRYHLVKGELQEGITQIFHDELSGLK